MKQALGLFARCNYLVYFKPKSQRSDTSMLCERYRVIVNACGRPILVAFWGNPCPPIFIPTNVHTTHIVYTSIYSIFIKIVPITQPTKFTSPQTKNSLAIDEQQQQQQNDSKYAPLHKEDDYRLVLYTCNCVYSYKPITRQCTIS